MLVLTSRIGAQFEQGVLSTRLAKSSPSRCETLEKSDFEGPDQKPISNRLGGTKPKSPKFQNGDQLWPQAKQAFNYL